ncbi:lipopolysaccharide A protein [Photobacterium sanctipauli]|uniref:Lipopolysaccharide A protein n=2 Tax=Photobacterium sanctipauli TaxID=1342794 RepID=A0A2T3NT29_9GAMM|nr:glycosyl transferase family 90 [Photobacterium sanctipauli]PSW19397.1 lipopolysaccharide A protein [Photobacterium sanctipauli]
METKHKNNKLKYYCTNVLRELLPAAYYQSKLTSKLNKLDEFDSHYIQQRVNYYLKHSAPFALPDEKSVAIKDFKKNKQSAYYYDLKEFLVYFQNHLRVAYRFGDDTNVETYPFLVKARPINANNVNAVLFKLNKVRHFNFINDPVPFTSKKEMMVWRGGAYRPHRRKFIEKFYNHPMCNVGQTNKPAENVPWQKDFMSIEEQLQYKFILCIEGNDVATNLKWAMSSNSLCVMPKPKYETWFMEGTLKAGVHYIEVADDYSDLEEKLSYYIAHTQKAQKIITNANEYVAQFKNKEREDLISFLVLKKYFELSDQVL